MHHSRFGFSTGALERGDYQAAVNWLRHNHIPNVELSALRCEELEPLIKDLPSLHIDDFSYVSFHAPSSFSRDREDWVINLLDPVLRRGWNIIVHPDVIYTPANWRRFGRQLLIENMDRRKFTGRTVEELRGILDQLPDARICLDVAHARQLDTTLTLLWSMISNFSTRIAEVHMSELDSRCRHLPLSWQAIADYRRFASPLNHLPVIIESMMPQQESNLRKQEIHWACEAMDGNNENIRG